jgi:hypothetical protein
MTNVRKHALSCSRYKGDIRESRRKDESIKKNTDVSHESIKANSYRKTSTAGMFHHGSTMLLSHYAEIHEQCCDSSMDLVERATYGCFAAFHHL